MGDDARLTPLGLLRACEAQRGKGLERLTLVLHGRRAPRSNRTRLLGAGGGPFVEVVGMLDGGGVLVSALVSELEAWLLRTHPELVSAAEVVAAGAAQRYLVVGHDSISEVDRFASRTGGDDPGWTDRAGAVAMTLEEASDWARKIPGLTIIPESCVDVLDSGPSVVDPGPT